MTKGYMTEAAAGEECHLMKIPDPAAEAEVESRLRTVRIGRPVKYFRELDSTNLYAKQLAEEGFPEGLLVAADSQTKGRGRTGRSWSTPPGKDIAMTLMLRPALPPERISMVTLTAGMAVVNACRSLYGLPVQIKWPNDVVYGGKKLCGILTEMSCKANSVSYIVIGIGVNVNSSSFPPALENKATSLLLELGRPVNRAELTAQIAESFEKYYNIFLETGDLSRLKDEYNAMLANLGKEVRVLEPGNEYTGRAEGIDGKGQLLVIDGEGQQKSIYAGEVSVRGLYGYV